MKKIFLIALVLSSCLVAHAQNECTIIGEVKDRPQSKELTLTIFGQDARHNYIAKIPITDGKFKYKFKFNEPEIYRLDFDDELKDNARKSVLFCAYDGVIDFILTPTINNNTITNNSDINHYNAYLYGLQDYVSSIKDELRQTSDSNRIKELNKKMLEAYGTVDKLLNKYEYKNPSIFTFYNLLCTLRNFEQPYFKEKNISDYEKKFNDLYAQKYPDHPYSKKCKEMIFTIKNIKEGVHLSNH